MAILTEYTGNSGLGLGGNPDIPVTTSKDLDVINQTSRDVYLNGIARNQQLFQEKIKKRDQLLSAIDSGDIRVGDLLEEDTPFVKEGLDKLDEAFENRVKKGVNDLDAAREYKKALRDAQDRVTQAQGRKVFYDSESGQIGQETLPRKQEARKKNLDNVIKGGFWKDITPYQQTQDLDIPGSILSTASVVTTPYTDPTTLTKGTRSVFDYEKTLDANSVNFLNDVNKRYDQEQLLNSIEKLPPKDFQQTISSINNRIKEYNDGKGLKPGQKGFVDEIKVEVDPQTGQGMISEKLPDFAAKFTLANQKPFASGTSEFDKERAAFELGKEKNKISAANAAANQMRARAYSALQNKKLSQMSEAEKQGNKIWTGIVERINTYKDNAKDDVLWAGDLPKGYTYIAGLDKDGKPIELKPKKKPQGSKYYDTRYKGAEGEDLNKDFLREKYDQYKSGGGKGDYKAYMRDLIKNGVINLEIVGENGTADFETTFQTVRALSNKLSTKGEEPVFGSEEVQTTTIDE